MAMTVRRMILSFLEIRECYNSKDDFLSDYENNYKTGILERENEILLVSTELTSRLKLRAIEDAYDYIVNLRNANGTIVQ